MLALLTGVLGILVGIWAQQQREKHERRMRVFDIEADELREIARLTLTLPEAYWEANYAIISYTFDVIDDSANVEKSKEEANRELDRYRLMVQHLDTAYITFGSKPDLDRAFKRFKKAHSDLAHYLLHIFHNPDSDGPNPSAMDDATEELRVSLRTEIEKFKQGKAY